MRYLCSIGFVFSLLLFSAPLHSEESTCGKWGEMPRNKDVRLRLCQDGIYWWVEIRNHLSYAKDFCFVIKNNVDQKQIDDCTDELAAGRIGRVTFRHDWNVLWQLIDSEGGLIGTLLYPDLANPDSEIVHYRGRSGENRPCWWRGKILVNGMSQEDQYLLWQGCPNVALEQDADGEIIP
jgi:hypothetical protein